MQFHPEDRARSTIDGQLGDAGWVVQSRSQMNLGAGLGVAVREFATGSGPADYALFVGRTLCGIVEAKPEGTTLSGFSEQAARYMADVPEHLVRSENQVRFEYLASSTETLFRNHADPAHRPRQHPGLLSRQRRHHVTPARQPSLDLAATVSDLIQTLSKHACARRRLDCIPKRHLLEQENKVRVGFVQLRQRKCAGGVPPAGDRIRSALSRAAIENALTGVTQITHKPCIPQNRASTRATGSRLLACGRDARVPGGVLTKPFNDSSRT